MSGAPVVAFAVGVAAALVTAGCGAENGTTVPVGPAAAATRRSANADRRGSWMAAEAKSDNLLYVSTRGTEDVYVYSYPKGKLVGTLTGFETPQGECVDSAGDVFITNTEAAQILEYAHGGTSPIATISDPDGVPQGCAIDPTTGDLAVADIGGNPSSTQGNIGIYPHASGTPKYYTDTDLYRPYFCGYDDKGNLFVDGTARPSGGFQLAELGAKSRSFTNIAVNHSIHWPGGVLWDGAYVAVGDEGDGYPNSTAVYEFSVSGSAATLEGTTPFTDADDIFQFWLDGKSIIGPDYDGQYVGFWKYPKGGYPTKMLLGHTYPFGTAISNAAP
jgi:hypothetical protein